MTGLRRLLALCSVLGGAAAAYRLAVGGAVTIDLGVGRRLQPLGPIRWTIDASPEVVFDVIAEPYLGRTPRALQEKLQVWERGADMVLAAHHSPVHKGLSATTVETVRFQPPYQVDFRLVRGPVPHVSESFRLEPLAGGTAFTWEGELGTDLWVVGHWWGRRVAGAWEATVRRSVEAISREAERRAKATTRLDRDA
jgi:hypothetical protein